ncbi:MAG: hypothetical protein JWR37_5604, partial [Mycobacterium sp.]|nr:hypothetical protein [Mycobacterium sp.]
LQLVKDTRDPGAIEADQVLIGKDAPNLVMTTSAAPASDTKESLWWISDQGVRYGIELKEDSLKALGVSPASAVQAPWPLIRVLAAGTPLSRDDALTQHDSLTPVVGAEALPTGQPQG